MSSFILYSKYSLCSEKTFYEGQEGFSRNLNSLQNVPNFRDIRATILDQFLYASLPIVEGVCPVMAQAMSGRYWAEKQPMTFN